MAAPKIGIIMGSASDLQVMQAAAEIVKEFGIPYAHERGLQVIIAGAGGAAHLPGMVASMTPLPVIGVPVKSSNSIDGWDSLLSIVQMPNGVPVATVAVNAAQNAGILAAQIIGASDKEVMKKMIAFKAGLKDKVMDASENLKNPSPKKYL
jgi:5-(carboxyamino)imidazole ribonucleotide mutase